MAESRINVFVFGIVFDWVRIDGDKDAPARETNDSELPWGRPAWEGGLPGMGGIVG